MESDAHAVWWHAFPALAGEEPEWREVAGAATLLHYSANELLFDEGNACERYLLIVAGSVRIQRTSEQGNEIVLNRVEAGQACRLTTSCLLSGREYPARAIAETPVTAAAFPLPLFERAMSASRLFRAFVFEQMDNEVTGLINLVEEVAFGHIDYRLAQRLLARVRTDGQVWTTHQELATEIGTAREVISRALKPMEKRGWLRLNRGRIEILDRAALEHLAQQGSV